MSTRTLAKVEGVAAALISNCLLGLSSLYWKALAAMSAITLLGFRILMSLVCVSMVLALRQELSPLLRDLSKRDLLLHGAAALLVATNWATFIWASIQGHVLESGLGYLIAPILVISLGLLLYRERLSLSRGMSLSLVLASLLYLLLNTDGLDYRVSMVIGVTWGGYAYLKKLARLPPWSGLFVESLMLSSLLVPLALWLNAPAQEIAALEAGDQGLLLLCGVVSLLPLALFSFATRRLPLSGMGLMQFVLPLTQLCVALSFYGQSPSPGTLLAFSVIALAILLVVLEPLLNPIFMKTKEIIENDSRL